MIKAVKTLNLISVFFFTAIFLLVYAYLPIAVTVKVDGIPPFHKQQFFTYVFISFITVNLLLYFITNYSSQFIKKEELAAWIKSIVFVINFYVTAMVGFIGVLNNSLSVRPESYAYLNFLGPIFLIIWVIGLIFFLSGKRNQ